MAPYEATRGSVALENSQNQRALSANQEDIIMVPATQQNPAVPATQLDPRLDEQNVELGHLTREERSARFALEQRKMEAELAAVQARTAAEVAAIEARTAREQEESQARIAAMRTEPATAGAAAAPTQENEEDSLTGEISPAALLVANKYPGLPKEEIARIFTNKFRLQNLYKLRHLQGREDKDQEENIFIKDGRMKLKRASENLRDFGASPAIWSESFLNYSSILVNFFGAPFPLLFYVLLKFHDQILKLSQIYEWQNAVLPLAIDFHTSITTANHTDVEAWADLSQTWIYQYCTATHTLKGPGIGSNKQAATTNLEGPTAKKGTGEICRNFNTKGCTFTKCVREHKCTECNSKDHGAKECPKAK